MPPVRVDTMVAPFIAIDALKNIKYSLSGEHSQLVIITDDTVKLYYGMALQQTLQDAGHPTLLLSFPPGEQSKTAITKSMLEEQMIAHGCDRDTIILALGGGVVGDLAGFIAATYMRGIAYIQVPTTLLAMVDSSIGGKTGIDTPHGKNMIGAFWQPMAIISDITCLTTLPIEQRINGLIEALKIFLTNDSKSFYYTNHHLDDILHGDSERLQYVIQCAVNNKMNIVQRDPCDKNERAVLNFGHTIGHALEVLSEYHLLHGYAVALGILFEAKIAVIVGMLSSSSYNTVVQLFKSLDITSKALQAFDVDAIIKATESDKKKRAGAVHYVLLSDIGSVYINNNRYAHPVSDSIVKQAFLALTQEK